MRLRKEAGLPDPSHYENIARQKRQELEDMKKELKEAFLYNYGRNTKLKKSVGENGDVSYEVSSHPHIKITSHEGKYHVKNEKTGETKENCESKNNAMYHVTKMIGKEPIEEGNQTTVWHKKHRRTPGTSFSKNDIKPTIPGALQKAIKTGDMLKIRQIIKVLDGDRAVKNWIRGEHGKEPVHEMTDDQMDKRERIVKGMKSKMSDFKKRYGDKAKQVMYATATKMVRKNEE
jgi:hypothetical protein